MSIVDQARNFERELVSRLRELEPLVNEYEQLRKAAERLGLKLPTASMTRSRLTSSIDQLYR